MGFDVHAMSGCNIFTGGGELHHCDEMNRGSRRSSSHKKDRGGREREFIDESLFYDLGYNNTRREFIVLGRGSSHLSALPSTYSLPHSVERRFFQPTTTTENTSSQMHHGSSANAYLSVRRSTEPALVGVSHPEDTLAYPFSPLPSLHARNGRACSASARFWMYDQNSTAPMVTKMMLVM